MNTHGIDERAGDEHLLHMTSLADQIRAHIQTQRRRAVHGYWERMGDTNKAHTVHKLTDLHACHLALLAVLDEHQPCEPPRQLLCNGCHHMEPCPTKVAISAALSIKGDVNA